MRCRARPLQLRTARVRVLARQEAMAFAGSCAPAIAPQPRECARSTSTTVAGDATRTEVTKAIPGENGIARSDVEAALEKWGRFKLTVNPENADLVVVVRKGGKPIKPTIGGTGNGPPVVWNPGSTGDVTIGVGRTSPPYSTPADPRESQRPTARTEVGFPDDVFSVYPARVDVRDASPLWLYIAHDGLQHPTVPAVQKFRKAIEEAEKTRKP